MELLAAISGGAIGMAVVWVIVIGLIAYLLWWLIGFVALPDPFNKIARALVAVAAVIFLINVLLSIVGKPFITF